MEASDSGYARKRVTVIAKPMDRTDIVPADVFEHCASDVRAPTEPAMG
jgi:hypothetical protein